MPNAVIFDYGVGNLLSLKIALEKVGLTTTISTSAKELSNADAIALPGVGNYRAATAKLEEVKETILTAVRNGTPLLGICLGLQIFFQDSEEGPGYGLSLFEGKTKWLPNSVKVPHMGWNTLNIVKQADLLDGVPEGAYVYFVHSLFPVPTDKTIICTNTEYGTSFTSAIASKNIYGTQFHPEKSGDIGLKILKNFSAATSR
jgi:imidazole glycerol-phosphate synthase subunit HisH